MSLLAATTGRTLARASATSIASSSTCSSGVTVLFESRRYVSGRRRANARKDRQGATIQRDAMGKPIAAKKERVPPLFTPLSPESLSDPLFEVSTREEISYPVFSAETVKEGSIGEALEFSTTREAQEARRQTGLPKTIWKDFKILPKPISVVRNVTLQISKFLSAVQTNKMSSEDARLVFSGRIGSGKSYALLQAVEWCLANGWIVLYIPRAVNLVNSTTPYAYDLRTQTFLQPEAALQILHRARLANSKIFKQLKLGKTLNLGEGYKAAPAGMSLYEFCDVSKEEVAKAPAVLELLVEELKGQTTHPVLLAVDDFQALFNQSLYRDPHFKPIATYHLSLPRLILSHFSPPSSPSSPSGGFKFGACLGALTSSDPAFPISLELKDMLGVTDQAAQPVIEEPYIKRSQVLKGYLQGVENVEVENRLTLKEAASLFEVWMKQRALSSSAHDELFMAKYVESAGNPRDFVWKGLLRTLQA
ncbi:hypothetical protein NP233_g4701 [Leucocoprinus birnbaumii]|uniref:Small ribosomal subunit protein mS29 n=1 Tax=Leucocoprinus birnbaumii TaxID=56174 RepID=A0AAD5VU86_9AGAR|nr:hypothetical protein NP233_g4701 [Leucocoprinus birnbaumii]